jgi:hypothetical protein
MAAVTDGVRVTNVGLEPIEHAGEVHTQVTLVERVRAAKG